MRKRMAIVAVTWLLGVAAPPPRPEGGRHPPHFHRENPPAARSRGVDHLVSRPSWRCSTSRGSIQEKPTVRHIVSDLATAGRGMGQTKLTSAASGVKWHDGKPSRRDVKCTFDAVDGAIQAGDHAQESARHLVQNVKDITTNGDSEYVRAEAPQVSFCRCWHGYAPIYACHANGREMRTKPIAPARSR